MFKVNKKPVYEESYIDFELLENNALKIWQLITGIPTLNFYEKFCSPFRIDSNAGCWLEPQSYSNFISFMDFGDRPLRHNKSIFQIIQQDKRMSPRECGQYLYHNYLQKIPEHQIIKAPKRYYKKKDDFKLDIRWKPRRWNNGFDKEFWNVAGITQEQLKLETWRPISEYWANKKSNLQEYYHHRCTTPTYGYLVKGLKKIYFPTKPKGHRFISQIVNQIGGRSPIYHEPFQLREIIITKSAKDHLLTSKVMNSRFTNSETVYLPLNFIKWLDDQFDVVYLLFDGDTAGRIGAAAIELQWKTVTGNNKLQLIFLPKTYDSYEYTKLFGFEAYEQQLLELTEEAKENLYNL